MFWLYAALNRFRRAQENRSPRLDRRRRLEFGWSSALVVHDQRISLEEERGQEGKEGRWSVLCF